MLFGHTIPEIRKALVAAAAFILSAIALFVFYDPALKEGIIVLVGSGVSVVAVFVAPRFSIEDLSKALGALVTSLQSVLAFFIVIDPNVWVMVGTIVLYLPAIYYFVWRVPNQPSAINGEKTRIHSEALRAATHRPPASSPPPPPPPPPGPPDPPRPPQHRPVS